MTVTTAPQPVGNTAVADESSGSWLEGIDWPIALSIVAYGVHIGVRANDPGIMEALGRHLPPGWEHSERTDVQRQYSLVTEDFQRTGRWGRAIYVDGVARHRCSTPQGLLRAFESQLQLYVAEMAPDRVFVHAGVVAYGGRGILLPGRSFAGKSTLVAELVRAGAEYYSDEYAVLDSSGGLYPYARPISMRQKGSAGVAKQPIETTSGATGTTPIPVGLVLLSKFRAGATWEPRRVSPGLGVLGLLANTVAARRIPDVAMATLRRIATGALIMTSERGEASTVVEPILELALRA